jgi:hypothetical protein
MTNATAPRYTHDCDTCLYLGNFEGADLYVCDNEQTTYIARYANGGPDYVSTRLDILQLTGYMAWPPILEARRRHVLALVGGAA